MNLQVESLKVMVTRQVVMNRMDYSTFINGTVKDELDGLERLEGKYRIQASRFSIEGLHGGKMLPQDDWKYFKECFGNRLPTALVNIIEGKEEFTIVKSKNGPKTWIMCDVNGWKNKALLTKRGSSKQQRSGNWGHFDNFIEDGWLVNTIKAWAIHNGKPRLGLDIRDSITVNKNGNVLRVFRWSAPNQGLNVTKTMLACRVPDPNFGQQPVFSPRRSLPRWEQFFDFSFPIYGRFFKKKTVDASKSLPPPHCGGTVCQ